MAGAVTSVLAACTSGDCDDLQQMVAPSSSTEPGTLRLGMHQSRTPYGVSAAPLAARSDGSVVCLTCSGIVVLDAGLREIGRPDIDGPASIVVAPDDSTYFVTPGPELDTSEIIALSPLGEPRWTVPIAGPFVKLVAATARAYVRVVLPRPGSAFVTPVIYELDAATGEQRTLATGHYLLGAANDGVFTFTSDVELPVTLHRLDRAGNVVWSRVLTSMFSDVRLAGAVATPDGSAIVFGSTRGMLDFGDRTLDVTHVPAGFVAGFDAAGATQWAFETGSFPITSLTLTAQGEILIASRVGGSYPGPDAESYVFLATPAGVVRRLTIDGLGNQEILGLAAAPDGLAWVQVSNLPFDDNRPGSVMHIGDRTFPDQGTYLFKIVP